PRLAGLWGDSCARFALGEPPGGAGGAHARACETLDALAGVLRPGAVAGAMRDCDVSGRAFGDGETGVR
ncbi:MAG: hypothetical protein WD969_01415, partial [Paracoccaceae bacterium]